MKKLIPIIILLSVILFSCDFSAMFNPDNSSSSPDAGDPSFPTFTGFRIPSSTNPDLTTDVDAKIIGDNLLLVFPEYVRSNYSNLIPEFSTNLSSQVSPDPSDGYIFTDDLKVTLTNSDKPQYKTIYNVAASVDPDSCVELTLKDPYYISNGERIYIDTYTVSVSENDITVLVPANDVSTYQGQPIGFGTVLKPNKAYVSDEDMYKLAYGATEPYNIDVTSGDGVWNVNYTITVDRTQSDSVNYNIYANCKPIYNWEIVDAGNDWEYQYSYHNVPDNIFTDYNGRALFSSTNFSESNGYFAEYDYSDLTSDFWPLNQNFILDSAGNALRAKRDQAINYNCAGETGTEYGDDIMLPISAEWNNNGYSYSPPNNKSDYVSSYSTFTFSGTWYYNDYFTSQIFASTRHCVNDPVLNKGSFNYNIVVTAKGDLEYTPAEYYSVSGYTFVKDGFSTFGDLAFNTAIVEDYEIDGDYLYINFYDDLTTETNIIGVVDLIPETGSTETAVLIMN